MSALQNPDLNTNCLLAAINLVIYYIGPDHLSVVDSHLPQMSPPNINDNNRRMAPNQNTPYQHCKIEFLSKRPHQEWWFVGADTVSAFIHFLSFQNYHFGIDT